MLALKLHAPSVHVLLLVRSCTLYEGDNLTKASRQNVQDLKNYIEMNSYDDPTYACRMCFSEIEKGAKTASINTRLENVK